MDAEFEVGTENEVVGFKRRSKSPVKGRSYFSTATSAVAVVLYLASIGVTCVIFGLFVHLTENDDSFVSIFNITDDSSVYADVSVIGCSSLLFFEILLIICGTASTVMGRRLTCPKVTEVFLVSLSVPTSMATSTAISLGYQDFCNGSCSAHEHFTLLASWVAVVLLVIALVVNIIGCLFSKPSQRETNRWNDKQWYDKSSTNPSSEQLFLV